ncbi:MAG TPA: zinc dependent phospholipase C family protein [Acidobacteriaceae bacterium]|nr:zinc dependent phospholipase C family protein [Acidobacteriaceae bacterium]
MNRVRVYAKMRRALALLLAVAIVIPAADAYSVLTHEQIIDLAWKDAIVPVLLARYPHATAAQLQEAHAYAYGGCLIQDEGYYPFGRQLFSNLTHYVRSGDFVASLIRNATNVDELAFALGALSHYVGDSIGHRYAVNPSTAIEFPNLRHKYGPVVTYDESPHGHVRTEFAFDIDQLSKDRIAPAAYWKHVGLMVPVRLLEQSFYETYGLRLNTMMLNERLAVDTYRWSVRSLLPMVANGEVVLHQKDFPADTPGPEFTLYKERLAQADFNNGWEHYRKKPGIRTHLTAFLIRILPKIGPFADLAIRGPRPGTEARYVESVNLTVNRYEELLQRLSKHPYVAPGLTLKLENRDLDTGDKARPGSYALMDETYARLLGRIVYVRGPIPATIKNDIEAYYSDPTAPITTKRRRRAWRRVQQQLTIIESMPVVSKAESCWYASQATPLDKDCRPGPATR